MRVIVIQVTAIMTVSMMNSRFRPPRRNRRDGDDRECNSSRFHEALQKIRAYGRSLDFRPRIDGRILTTRHQEARPICVPLRQRSPQCGILSSLSARRRFNSALLLLGGSCAQSLQMRTAANAVRRPKPGHRGVRVLGVPAIQKTLALVQKAPFRGPFARRPRLSPP
jgi:hypothetical protein